MDATTVDDLLTRDQRDDRTALVDATGREFDSHWLCTTAWKSGNFLRHAGVREGVTVGVVGEGPLALIAFFGTTLLEGRTQFDPPTALAGEDDLRALVAPVAALDRYELPRGAQRVGYGDRPQQPDVHHFDAGLWSENPSFPPLDVAPDTDLLTDGDRTYTHEGVLKAASHVIEQHGIDRGDRIVVRAPLSDPRTVTVGVIAPLVAGGTIVLIGDESAAGEGDATGTEDVASEGEKQPDDETDTTSDDRTTYVISADSIGEPHRIDPDSVPLR